MEDLNEHRLVTQSIGGLAHAHESDHGRLSVLVAPLMGEEAAVEGLQDGGIGRTCSSREDEHLIQPPPVSSALGASPPSLDA